MHWEGRESKTGRSCRIVEGGWLAGWQQIVVDRLMAGEQGSSSGLVAAIDRDSKSVLT